MLKSGSMAVPYLDWRSGGEQWFSGGKIFRHVVGRRLRLSVAAAAPTRCAHIQCFSISKLLVQLFVSANSSGEGTCECLH
jgi:hypothetical protein